MKHIKQFEKFITESSSNSLKAVIDALTNSMEYYDEDTFMDFGKEMGYDPEMMKEVYNDYWNLNAKDRMKWGDRDWTKWLKKYEIK
jgi:hypothetical protein